MPSCNWADAGGLKDRWAELAARARVMREAYDNGEIRDANLVLKSQQDADDMWNRYKSTGVRA